jgi:hypothetical protein
MYCEGGSSNGKDTGMGGTVKNGKISNMLSEYEKTRTFNKELLKNIGSPKGPIFARANGQLGNIGDNENLVNS